MTWKEALAEVILTGAVPRETFNEEANRLFANLAENPPPQGAYRLPLTQGQWALVDAEDFDRLSQRSWCVSQMKDGTYIATSGTKQARTVTLHQEVLPVDPPLIVDHINRDRLDCRKSNLRPATHSQNGANSKRKSKQSHGFKGIYFAKARGTKPWCAQIKLNYKTRSLGRYATPEEAARAYDKAAREVFGEFARCNFPNER